MENFLNYLHNFVKEKDLTEAAVQPPPQPLDKAPTTNKDGWEISTKESPEDFGKVHTAKKDNIEITFESSDAKKFYENNYAPILPLDDIHKFVNPSGIKLDAMSIKVGISNSNTLSLSLQGTTPESSPDPTNPVRHTTMIDMEMDKDKLSLKHAQFPASAQGQSVLKDFFKQGLPIWESKGVKSLDLSAVLAVGGHAWAKYGFDFASDALRKQFTTAFKAYVKSKGVKLENPDGYNHSWDIAAQTAKGYNGKFGDKIGKEFMMEYTNSNDPQGLPNSWKGTLDLTKGSAGRTQLNAYINGGVTKADAHITKKSKMTADPFSVYTALQKPKAAAKKQKPLPLRNQKLRQRPRKTYQVIVDNYLKLWYSVKMINSDKVKGSLIGACAGEALGATVEFMSAAEIKAQYGVLKDIIGGGVFGWETGEATDDIDMMFAVAKSLMELKTLDPADIAKKLVDWYNTNPKDIGGTTRMSLSNLWRGIPWDKASDPNNQYGAGNGSIVRCTPVILAYADKPLDECVDACDKTGLITHAHPLARWSVRFYATLLHRILNEQKGVAIADATAMANSFTPAHGGTQYNFEIKSNPTGFACDALATALFCLKQTSTLEDAVIMTVNLGGDTASIAAVTGAIGGAIYGESAIPVRWVEKLKLSSIGMSIKFDGMIQRKEIHG